MADILARARVKAALASSGRESLLEFIPRVSPRFTSPTHLAPFIQLLECSWREPIRAVLSTPPRHFKSFTTFHWIVQTLKHRPTTRIAYVTYGAEFSEQQGKLASFIADHAGLGLTERRASFWRTAGGGRVDWTSIGGQLTGKGFDVILVDDPVKGRKEAESAIERESAWAWFNGDAYTRLEPGGSVVVIQTRWHPDDLAGRLIAQGWPRISLPAINDAGEALCPERFSVDDLEQIRKQIGEYEWASLYQGEPRSKGGRVFGDAHQYLKLPEAEPGKPALAFRKSIGADFAYTKKTYADYSVAIVMAEHAGVYYVLDLVRAQLEAPAFANRLLPLQTEHGVKVHAYIGGTERGVIQFLKDRGVRMEDSPAIADKFARAQPVAAAWNAGKVMIPDGAPWAGPMLAELADFTGVSDRHDDQVDALAAAFDALAKPAPARGVINEPFLAF